MHQIVESGRNVMHRIWLRWKDKLDLKTGRCLTELEAVEDRAAARTLDDEAEAEKFLSLIRPELKKTLPGYVWSVEKYSKTRPVPRFAIAGER
jgi:hypothetical protein